MRPFVTMKNETFRHPRRSGISSWGLYKRSPITKDTRIIDYAGELITHRESGAAVEVCAVLIGTTP